MSDKLMEMLPDKVVHYVGRDESASPATGSFKLHQIEEQEMVTQALGRYQDVGEKVASI
jgi:2-oxoglutarate dehydrogenase complex dehydrogenase (E1) component-like enzyme